MKKHNMFELPATTALIALLALAALPARGQNQQAIANLDGASEHLKVEDGNVWARKSGKAWENPLPATIGNAVKKLRELYPEATFAVDPRVAEQPVTDLIVRSTDPAVDLSALRTASGGKFALNHSGANSLYTLEPNENTTTDDRRIECINLSAYLASASTPEKDQRMARELAIERLQDIIQKSIHEFDPSIKQPDCKFYPDGQLLVVIGPERAIEVAVKITKALSNQPTLTPVRPPIPALSNNPVFKP